MRLAKQGEMSTHISLKTHSAKHLFMNGVSRRVFPNTLSLLLQHIAVLTMLMRRLGSQNTFCGLLLMNPIVSFVAVTVWFGREKKQTKKTTKNTGVTK